MNSVLIRIIKCLCFGLILALVLDVSGNVLKTKQNRNTIVTFSDEKEDSLDVLMLGSSHIYSSLQPQYWWKYYGITSYNLGTMEQTIAQSYHVLKMALNTQSPDLVIVGVNQLNQNAKSKSDARTHIILDNMPMSKEWLEALWDLVDENRVEYLIPALAYHDRWNELTEEDFTKETSHSKGSYLYWVTKSFEKPEPVDPDDCLPIREINMTYIDKLIELCDQKDIKLMFVLLTYPQADEDPDKELQRCCNTLSKYVEQYDNVEFLNLYYSWDEMGLDGETDFSDHKHVNADGAFKESDYVAKYIVENYGIADHRGEAAYADWDADFDAYMEELYEKITNPKIGKKARERFLPRWENGLADYYAE